MSGLGFGRGPVLVLLPVDLLPYQPGGAQDGQDQVEEQPKQQIAHDRKYDITHHIIKVRKCWTGSVKSGEYYISITFGDYR
jgi:hypothetical protein